MQVGIYGGKLISLQKVVGCADKPANTVLGYNDASCQKLVDIAGPSHKD